MTISIEELQLAARNHGLPLEALRHDITPAGLHYLLVHYDIPVIEPAAWQLSVGGRVSRELSLSLDELQGLPTVTEPVTFECAGNGRALMDPRALSQPWLREAVGTGEWTGTPLRGVLEAAGVLDDAVEVVFTGIDRGVEAEIDQAYARSLSVSDALSDGVLLVWGMNGGPLPPQHGFPLRLVVPGWYGMANVKWLGRIEVVAEPFEGYQQTRAYRWRADDDDPGQPITRMVPRALIAPPGVPDFYSRRRFVEAGRTEVEGRAWSGFGPIERVEVSGDGGATWAEATLEPAVGRWAWARWTWTWAAEPGETELCARCWDATGAGQPDEPPWNVGGYANNAIHRVPVTVR